MADAVRNNGLSVPYRFLDVLRGFAALYVFLYHIGLYFGGLTVAANGYLAVDFFFVLSGFVLASAYERRLAGEMSFGSFAQARALRLLPLSGLGVALGSTFLLLRFVAGSPNADPLPTILGACALNLLLLPKLWHSPGAGTDLFPANPSLWSLFFEVVVNLAWARFMVGARLRVLLLAMSVGAVVFVLSAVRLGTVNIGWDVASFAGGLGRVVFGFTCGVVIFRLRGRIHLASPAWPWLALIILTIAVLAPFHNLTWTLPSALILLPLAVLFGAQAGASCLLPGGDLLGRLSYPLYALHMPLVMIAATARNRLLVGEHSPLLALALSAAVVVVSYVALRFFDEPVRRWLGSRHQARQRAKLAAGAGLV